MFDGAADLVEGEDGGCRRRLRELGPVERRREAPEAVEYGGHFLAETRGAGAGIGWGQDGAGEEREDAALDLGETGFGGRHGG